ncbi:MAG: cytochrome ubiquinol oxidase subunit I [Armatimonadota bacterium]
MDAELLARWQFAVTIGYHFLFAPLTIGLSWLIFWLMTRYKRTGDPAARNLARFWVNLFAISFAVGVATGIVNEFQFGTNWARYSRFVGDIFGPPLAAEVIFTFFLESTFLAVLLLGWNRVSPKAQWFASLAIAVGSTMSAFWILAANSWMQTPAGYEMAGGHPVLTNFWGALWNHSTLQRFLHTVVAALMTGSFFMLGISAWFLLKNRHVRASRMTLVVSLVVAFVTSMSQLPSGHMHAVQVAETQPAKLAAFEGLFETQSNAPLILFGILDEENRTVRYAVRAGGMLSFLVSFRTSTEVTGLDRFPRSEWPPLKLTFYPFHLMVAIGLYLIAFSTLGLLLALRKRLFTLRGYLIAAIWTIPLPFLANELGWITAEVGRQPWIVYGVMRTSDATSQNVEAGHVLFSLIVFGLVYAVFTLVWALVVRHELRKGPEEIEAETTTAPEKAS